METSVAVPEKIKPADALASVLEKDEQLRELFHEDFGTDPKLVAKGIIDLRDALAQFPQYANILQALAPVFLGLTAERGATFGTQIERIPKQDQRKLESFFNERGFMIVDHAKKLSMTEQLISHLRALLSNKVVDKPNKSVINLPCAAKIIDNTRKRGLDVFPPEINSFAVLRRWLSHTPAWLANGVTRKEIVNVRLGLLSGYPVRSALEHRETIRAENRLYNHAKKSGIAAADNIPQPSDETADLPDRVRKTASLLKGREYLGMKEDVALLERTIKIRGCKVTSAADATWFTDLEAYGNRALTLAQSHGLLVGLPLINLTQL